MTSQLHLALFGFSALMLATAVVMMLRARSLRSRIGFGLLTAVSLLVLLAFGVPLFVKPRVVYSRSACIANLKQLEGAKATWELEFKKKPGDVPSDQDLFGTNGYIRERPTCPQGGSYRIGAVGQKPVCSLGTEGHRLDP